MLYCLFSSFSLLNLLLIIKPNSKPPLSAHALVTKALVPKFSNIFTQETLFSLFIDYESVNKYFENEYHQRFLISFIYENNRQFHFFFLRFQYFETIYLEESNIYYNNISRNQRSKHRYSILYNVQEKLEKTKTSFIIYFRDWLVSLVKNRRTIVYTKKL